MSKPTLWTGAATDSSVLSQLDMTTARRAVDRGRIDRLRTRVKRDLAPFTSRSTAESLRKLVK